QDEQLQVVAAKLAPGSEAVPTKAAPPNHAPEHPAEAAAAGVSSAAIITSVATVVIMHLQLLKWLRFDSCKIYLKILQVKG
ncbi:MAG TPA: hypothetical protein VKR99_00360, partial [Candidatus Eremiobacteraceae bacterium]|nr:hypothetical protein [Candidatus Eremiobacteraceae bacterium]